MEKIVHTHSITETQSWGVIEVKSDRVITEFNPNEMTKALVFAKSLTGNSMIYRKTLYSCTACDERCKAVSEIVHIVSPVG